MERDGIYIELVSQDRSLVGCEGETYDSIWQSHCLEDMGVKVDHESCEYRMQEDGQQYLCVDCPLDEAED